MNEVADVVICGAGIAGISAAYYLSIGADARRIILVDERPPLSLTSDKSTECYRNWWPGPDNAMVALMNRSIDLLETLAEESGNIFHLNRRGYLYLTANPDNLESFHRAATIPPSLGSGELRVYTGSSGDPIYIPSLSEDYHGIPSGADIFLNPDLIQKIFPYIATDVLAALHVRRAGWLSAHQLGTYLLENAKTHGVQLLTDRVINVSHYGGRIAEVELAENGKIATNNFINAAGPMIGKVARWLDVQLPIYSELHLKAAIHDVHQVVPRQAPLLIWNDAQYLPWSPDELEYLSAEEDQVWLSKEMPSGVHTRPEGGGDSDIILMLWEYKPKILEPVFPPPVDELYPEIVLRGLAKMLPGMNKYLSKIPRPVLDGGYYTRTRENRPLIGPLPIDGAFIIGALSGFGIMAACAAGELLASHINQSQPPAYASSFVLERYTDPNYQMSLEQWGDSGQL